MLSEKTGILVLRKADFQEKRHSSFCGKPTLDKNDIPYFAESRFWQKIRFLLCDNHVKKMMNETMNFAELDSLIKLHQKQSRQREEELEEIAMNRMERLNRAFEWTGENIEKFRELDDFLRQKMRLCYEKALEAEERCAEILSHEAGFMGGEVEISARIELDYPDPCDDEKEILPGVGGAFFRFMIDRANHMPYEVRCSSYHPLGHESAEQNLEDDMTGYPFPHGAGSKLSVCRAFDLLNRSLMFAYQDLLDLNRELFGIQITLSNFF